MIWSQYDDRATPPPHRAQGSHKRDNRLVPAGARRVAEPVRPSPRSTIVRAYLAGEFPCHQVPRDLPRPQQVRPRLPCRRAFTVACLVVEDYAKDWITPPRDAGNRCPREHLPAERERARCAAHAPDSLLTATSPRGEERSANGHPSTPNRHHPASRALPARELLRQADRCYGRFASGVTPQSVWGLSSVLDPSSRGP